MTRQQKAVEEQVQAIGPGYCDVCDDRRADCLKFRSGIFANTVICDTCLSLMLRKCTKGVGGDA